MKALMASYKKVHIMGQIANQMIIEAIFKLKVLMQWL